MATNKSSQKISPTNKDNLPVKPTAKKLSPAKKKLSPAKEIFVGLNRKGNNQIVDVSKALKMFFTQGMTKTDIAKFFGVTIQTICHHLKPFENMMVNGDGLTAYQENRALIKDNVEFILLSDLADVNKRGAATLNNVAYAYRQVHETRRLDEGQSTANVDLHAEFETVRKLDETARKLREIVGIQPVDASNQD